jgi:hypothetical protein
MKPQERLDSGPTTNSVPIDIGTTAAEGARQGQEGNAEFNRGLQERSTGAPAHRDYRPESERQDWTGGA